MSRFRSFLSPMVICALLLSGCATSLGAQLGLHKSMNDKMIFDAIKSHTDQNLVDQYSAMGSNAAMLMNWVDAKPDPRTGGFLDELRKEMVARNPQWSAPVKQAVLAGKIAKGMDEKQVLSSWGSPTERQATHLTGKYQMETWQYIAHSPKTTLQALGVRNRTSAAEGGVKYYGMVLFRSGKVSSWSTFD